MGRSLGSAVATYVASKRQIDKLVLITPFDSVQSVAQSQFPIYPMGLLLKDKHDSYSRTKNIEAKTLIVAAELDRVIKMPHTQRLLEGFDSDVEFHVIEGASHNNIGSSPRYYGILKGFL
jgi:pimeloyl-ACP methyl ester carboxylesterase